MPIITDNNGQAIDGEDVGAKRALWTIGRALSYARAVSDTFARPADTTPYSANDRLSASTTNSGTTPLRGLDLARSAGEPFRIRFLRITSNSSTFLPRIRVHLYSAAQPATAIPGDNSAYPIMYANAAQRIGYFDLPALTLPGGTGSDSVSTSIGQLNDLDFLVAPDAADTKIYYALEILDAATPSSGQSFTIDVRVMA